LNGFTLHRVLQLAQQRAENLARAVKQAHGEWLRARGRQVQLRGLRQTHAARLAERLQQGLPASQLLDATRLQQAQDREMRAAQGAIDLAYAEWQARLAVWMQAEQRVKALQVLKQRALDRAAIKQKRIDQRQHDELVELARFRQESRRP
jgi:flagellar export protein FliJ